MTPTEASAARRSVPSPARATPAISSSLPRSTSNERIGHSCQSAAGGGRDTLVGQALSPANVFWGSFPSAVKHPLAATSLTYNCEVVMYTRRCLLLGLLAAALLPAQDAPPSIQVTGAVKQALTLSADDLAKMPRASVRTTNNGMETVYEGVWLHEVLQKAGVPQGSELRVKALASYVLAEARTATRSYSRSASSTPRLSTIRFCWRTPRMASPCSVHRAGSAGGN